MAARPDARGASAAARIEVLDDSRIRVHGPLTFASVPALSAAPAAWIRRGASVAIDLSDVSHADSAGLAMVLDWLSQARAAGATLKLQGAPAQMLAIARASGLSALFDDDTG